jgi:hypothetical protein
MATERAEQHLRPAYAFTHLSPDTFHFAYLLRIHFGHLNLAAHNTLHAPEKKSPSTIFSIYSADVASESPCTV